MLTVVLSIILAPLISSIIVGFFGRFLGKSFSHCLAILGVGISTVLAIWMVYQVEYLGLYYNGLLYTWLTIGSQSVVVGALIDQLTSVMLLVVSSVSLMVHIYTIGYMAEEEGYTRFFSYISLFTFMMFMLVISNNLVQLFFGWEGVGLVSYLLIGFYFKRESAIFANLKAFLINRIGDLGFLLGIGLIFAYTGSFNYIDIFAKLPYFANTILPIVHWNLISVICILLFIGAMGKSAQFPLHVWLPDSMEGPTPISALIHAATMVTAGIFMVARFSPIFNLSSTALTFMIIIGGINCLFLGILALVQNDIKRVIAYSTLSQLGYMVVALGSGAYSIAIFHLMTHAFFKGLLFLGAGSVILAMHHEQDMRKMGGLAKYMPITYITMLIGSLALSGIPPFAGFFSKDLILESIQVAYSQHLSGSLFALITAYLSVTITAIYTFRMIFMTFHGAERFTLHDHHAVTDKHISVPTESPLVVTLPLILMAIPSAIVGWWTMPTFLKNSVFTNSVFNSNWYQTDLQNTILSSFMMMKESIYHLPIYLAVLGILIAWCCHTSSKLLNIIVYLMKPINVILERKYYMDDLYINLLAPLGRHLAKFLWHFGDMLLIDGLVVNGSAKLINWYSNILKRIQGGYVNTYATFMVLGIIILLTFCTKIIFT